MSETRNPIVETYSELADRYDEEGNVESCWGHVTRSSASAIQLKNDYRTVADVGCGTAWAISGLAEQSSPDVQFIGIDPAANMCRRAKELTAQRSNVRILRGSFEDLPLADDSIDYLYSTLAFHWCPDLDRAVTETARVLKRSGEMDLIFIGRDNGREFIRKTTPIFFKFLGPARLLQSAGLRKQLTKDAALDLFDGAFPGRHLSVEESFETFYDTLDGHWNWWVRIEGHFVDIPPQKKEACDAAVKAALATLDTPQGIPYTVHLLHVKVRQD